MRALSLPWSAGFWTSALRFQFPKSRTHRVSIQASFPSQSPKSSNLSVLEKDGSANDSPDHQLLETGRSEETQSPAQSPVASPKGTSEGQSPCLDPSGRWKLWTLGEIRMLLAAFDKGMGIPGIIRAGLLPGRSSSAIRTFVNLYDIEKVRQKPHLPDSELYSSIYREKPITAKAKPGAWTVGEGRALIAALDKGMTKTDIAHLGFLPGRSAKAIYWVSRELMLDEIRNAPDLEDDALLRVACQRKKENGNRVFTPVGSRASKKPIKTYTDNRETETTKKNVWWTEEELALLLDSYREGKRVQEIARALGSHRTACGAKHKFQHLVSRIGETLEYPGWTPEEREVVSQCRGGEYEHNKRILLSLSTDKAVAALCQVRWKKFSDDLVTLYAVAKGLADGWSWREIAHKHHRDTAKVRDAWTILINIARSGSGHIKWSAEEIQVMNAGRKEGLNLAQLMMRLPENRPQNPIKAKAVEQAYLAALRDSIAAESDPDSVKKGEEEEWTTEEVRILNLSQQECLDLTEIERVFANRSRNQIKQKIIELASQKAKEKSDVSNGQSTAQAIDAHSSPQGAPDAIDSGDGSALSGFSDPKTAGTHPTGRLITER